MGPPPASFRQYKLSPPPPGPLFPSCLPSLPHSPSLPLSPLSSPFLSLLPSCLLFLPHPFLPLSPPSSPFPSPLTPLPFLSLLLLLLFLLFVYLFVLGLRSHDVTQTNLERLDSSTNSPPLVGVAGTAQSGHVEGNPCFRSSSVMEVGMVRVWESSTQRETKIFKTHSGLLTLTVLFKTMKRVVKSLLR